MTHDPRETLTAAYQNTDDADPALVLAAVRHCALSWDGDARLLGNVRAKDIVRAIDALSTPPAAAESDASVEAEFPAWTEEDKAYELGRRDGYELAVQDIDLATGGDGEFKGSTIPGETVDVQVMKQRIIDRFAANASAEARLREAFDSIAHAVEMLSEHIEKFHDFDYAPHEVPLELADLRGIQHHLLGSLIDENGNALSAGGDEAKKSEGGVEGRAQCLTTARQNDSGFRSCRSSVEAGIKPGPSDPTAERREIVAFPRWWVEQVHDQLRRMKLPSGQLGDWAFIFREHLYDKLTEGGRAALDGGR